MSRMIYAMMTAAPLALLASSTIAGPLDGTWKIDKPQTSLAELAGGQLPFTAWGKEQAAKNQAASASGNHDFDLTASRCSSPGLPRLMLMPQRFKILQEKDVIVVLFEWNRLFRQIDMRPQPYETEIDSGPKMIGLSKGRWQGKTLVVSTNDLSDQTLLDDTIPHSDGTTLKEEFQQPSNDHLVDTLTISDPKLFTRPVTIKLTYHRVADDEFPEDVCLDRLPPPAK